MREKATTTTGTGAYVAEELGVAPKERADVPDVVDVGEPVEEAAGEPDPVGRGEPVTLLLGVGLPVGGSLRVGLPLPLCGVAVGVPEGEGDSEGEGVMGGDTEGVGGLLGVVVGVGAPLPVLVGVPVWLGVVVDESVAEGVVDGSAPRLRLPVGLAVEEGTTLALVVPVVVPLGVGEDDGVGVPLQVAVSVGEADGVGVGVPLPVPDGVWLPVPLCVGVEDAVADPLDPTVDEDEEGAKFALTEYAVVATAGTEFAWVAARPITGRTHQIRVHLASLGTPIVGDFKYGGADVRGRGEIADKLHLHARQIDIARPDGGRLNVTAPLPPHMEKSWAVLGFNPDDGKSPFPPKKHESKPKAPPRPDALRSKKPKPTMQKARRKATATGRRRK